MIKVMFICLGNICRSPMAEFIFKDLVRKEGLDKNFEISSAGTSAEEEGNPVYPPARSELERHGISCAGKRAKKYEPSDYANADYILPMEARHVRSILRISGDPAGKVHRLADFTPNPHDIADPWYTRDFPTAYKDIYQGCAAFLEYLKKTLPASSRG